MGEGRGLQCLLAGLEQLALPVVTAWEDVEWTESLAHKGGAGSHVPTWLGSVTSTPSSGHSQT